MTCAAPMTVTTATTTETELRIIRYTGLAGTHVRFGQPRFFAAGIHRRLKTPQFCFMKIFKFFMKKAVNPYNFVQKYLVFIPDCFFNVERLESFSEGRNAQQVFPGKAIPPTAEVPGERM